MPGAFLGAGMQQRAKLTKIAALMGFTFWGGDRQKSKDARGVVALNALVDRKCLGLQDPLPLISH